MLELIIIGTGDFLIGSRLHARSQFEFKLGTSSDKPVPSGYNRVLLPSILTRIGYVWASYRWRDTLETHSF
jgi:hypothetical protein